MSQSETAKVLIPKEFRHWFAGAKEKELEVYDISELPGLGMFGTIKIDNVPVWV